MRGIHVMNLDTPVPRDSKFRKNCNNQSHPTQDDNNHHPAKVDTVFPPSGYFQGSGFANIASRSVWARMRLIDDTEF